ncbi:MAG: DNA polymerase III subunit gamma/tau [Waddliaceae bacterium]
MTEYQVIARKYRPKNFSEVLGQEPIVTTLKNAILQKHTAHAYLFSGPRGTGKTTLARIFAKALNCLSSEDVEPCNSCKNCLEISSGNSLDVLEVDGASNRGIEDIRQINETVSYTPSANYKIYIIDEVHMLTKEAFNALLKTLEEPPERVKFFFATTELHKVLPTIQSRCQKFSLKQIDDEVIVEKLLSITSDLNVQIDREGLQLIAERAEGGLRDAESLLDQILTFHDSPIHKEHVADSLGVVTKDLFFTLDRGGKEGDLKVAFDISKKVVSEGKDIPHFLVMLTEHIRNILLIKLGNLNFSEEYLSTANFYRADQCADLIEYLVNSQEKIRYTLSGKTHLEAILLHVLRSHQRIPIDVLVRKLSQLENSLSDDTQPPHSPPPSLVTTSIKDKASQPDQRPAAKSEPKERPSNKAPEIDQTPTVSPKETAPKEERLPPKEPEAAPAATQSAVTRANAPKETVPKEERLPPKELEVPPAATQSAVTRADTPKEIEPKEERLPHKELEVPPAATQSAVTRADTPKEIEPKEERLPHKELEVPPAATQSAVTRADTPKESKPKGNHLPPKAPTKAEKCGNLDSNPEVSPGRLLDKKTQSRYDTLLQFAAVELEGKIIRR